MVIVPILVFPDGKKEFHVHAYTSYIVLGELLSQEGDGDIDHPIAFTNRKLSKVEKNYTTTQCEGLVTVNSILEEFWVYNQKRIAYHPQVNGTLEGFNIFLENALMKVYNTQRIKWDMHVPIVLWAYRMTYKKLTGQAPFRLVYGIEVVMPMEYIVPSLHIASLIKMMDHETLKEWLA